MAISHVFTNPVPDGTITSIVRPSDWNSAHNQYYTLSGNVLGASTVSGTNVVFQAGANVSLSGTGRTIVIQGTNTPQPTSYVSNVNGLSGAVSLAVGSSLSSSANGSSITFGLASNITTALQSANSNYLTTQTVQTQASGNIAGTGFTSTTTAGTAVVGTLGTGGLSVGVPAYLTTQSVQTQASGNIVGSGFTSTTTAGTAIVGTQNSQGLSLGVPAYLTTQSVQTQASGNIAGTGFTSTTTAGTAVVGTLGTGGLSIGVPAFLTTAAGGGGVAIAGGTQTATSGTVVFSNSNGVTFGLNNGTLTASAAGAAAMYANLSGNTTGNTTASGSTLNFSGINITLSGTNGSQIAISAPAASGLSNGNNIAISSTGSTIGISAQAVAVGAGSQTATSGTVNFVNSNGVTFGMSGSNQITASVAAAAGMYANLSGATSGNTTASGNTLNFSGINVTLSGTNASQIAISAPATSSLSAGNNISLSSNGSTIGLSALAVGLNTAQTNVTWTVNSSGISLNAAGYAGTNTSANNASLTLNSNGLTISVAPPGAANYSIGVSNLGNTAGSTGITGTRIVFVGTNNISLSQSTDANGATISINQTGGGGGGGGGIAAAAGTQTATSGTVNFANSNGITFGMSGSSQITASYTVPTVPTSYVSNVNGSSGQISLNVGSSLSSSTNGSSITFGLASNITTALQSAGNYLTTAAQSSASNLSIAVAATNNAGGGTATLASSISFGNANGLTFYTSAGNAIVASYTVPTQSVQTQASGAIAGTGFTSTTTAGTAVTAALGTNGLNMAIPAYLTTQSVQTQASGNIAGVGFTSTTTAGTAVVGTLSTNGLSLGVPAYLTAAAGGAGNFNLSGATSGNTTASGNTINLSGINITLSGTNASQIAISAPATSSLVAGNNISISTNGSSINFSALAVAAGAGTQTATSGTLVFSNSNGITFGMSGSSRITASYTQSNQAFSASGGSSTFQTLNFANSNGITFSNTGGSVVASYTVPATTGFAGTGFTSTTTAGTAVQGTLDTSGLSLAIPVYLTNAAGGGLTNVNVSAGTTSNDLSNVVFSNANNVSFGLNGSTVTASIATSLTNVNVSAGTASNNLSNVVFSNANGVSFGLNGSSITASVAANLTQSGYNHYNDVVLVQSQVGQASLIFDHIELESPVQFDRYGMLVFNTNSSNSSGSHTISFWLGLYTQNVSSLSLLGSTSTSLALTHSGTAGSYSLYSAMRQVTVPYTTTLSQGEYYLGVVSRTTSGGANGSYSQMMQSNAAVTYGGLWGQANNATNQVFLGVGLYSATTSGMPGSVAFSEIRGTAPPSLNPPVVIFQSGTI